MLLFTIDCILIALGLFMIVFIICVRILTRIAMKRFDQEEEEVVEEYWGNSICRDAEEMSASYREAKRKLKKIARRREDYLSR